MTTARHAVDALPPWQVTDGRTPLAVSGWLCGPPCHWQLGLGEGRWPLALEQGLRLDVGRHLAPTLGWPNAGLASAFLGFAWPGADGGELFLAGTAAGQPCRLELGPPPPLRQRVMPDDTTASVVVCMATHEPDPLLFARQIASLRAQDFDDWCCLMDDDASSDASRRAMTAVLGKDPRFRVRWHEDRLGFYGNFDRCLARVPRFARFVALADQDDHWHPDKLATLLGAMTPGVSLSFGDVSTVDRHGRNLTAPPPVRNLEQTVNHPPSLLLMNHIPGATMLLRRDVLDLALPLPPPLGVCFHDHWLALCARSQGRLRHLRRPVQDYVQHEGNVIGHEDRRGAGRHPSLLAALTGLAASPLSVKGREAFLRETREASHLIASIGHARLLFQATLAARRGDLPPVPPLSGLIRLVLTGTDSAERTGTLGRRLLRAWLLAGPMARLWPLWGRWLPGPRR